MNFGIATAQNASSLDKPGFATATAEPPRLGQVERALQELEQGASFLEKHVEQLFNRLSSVVAPVPAPTQGSADQRGGVAALCPVASRIETQVERIRRVVAAVEAATNLIEL